MNEIEDVTNIKRKKLRKQKLERIFGSFGGVFFYVVLLLVGARFLVMHVEERGQTIEVQIMDVETVDLEEFEQQLEQIEELQDLTDMISPQDMFDMNQPPEVDTSMSDSMDMDLADLNVVQDFQSPLVLRGLYAGRSEEGRSRLLAQHGGRWAAQTEAAVNRALVWLKNNQQDDGSWRAGTGGDTGDRMRVGITGLALLAFLAHGETPASAEFGRTVEKAIRFLADRQTPSGHFINTDDAENANYKAGTYGHAIATYAISEAFALTRIPSLGPAMEKAVDVIMKGQQTGGGWFYRYEKGSSVNNSVSVWQMQALKAAQMAGAKNPGLNDSLNRAAEFLKTRQHESGRFFYIQPHIQAARQEDYGITAASVLSLQLLGQANSREARLGMQELRGASVEWERPPTWAMSEWYYITQTKFHTGGQTWRTWNDHFAPVFIRSQNGDGSWASPARSGANIPFGFEHFFGDAFSTSMAVLTLTVYYRFLPTYQAIAVEEEAPRPQSNEIRIEII
ncbi:MAG TPA: terpene cyclase/mutase family protein [Kiritimatiellia bacterium]|nr:terpene cyclase/mutase family protein [Kiritimatiellia bacterium]